MLDFEAIQAGDELVPLLRPPLTITQLVMYCGGLHISDPIHFSPEIARANGFPDVIVNGSLRVAFLAQAVAQWHQGGGFMQSLTCKHKAMLLLRDPVETRGRVVSKWLSEGTGYVQLEIWNESDRTGIADYGEVVVAFDLSTGPSKHEAITPSTRTR